jgi:cytochrome d ubiquinol oxidase subunit II
MFYSVDLTVAWALLLAFAVYVYVILDGFDLGIGILYPLFPTKRDRDLLMNSVAPVWDGNETWLVLGGGGLFAAFPLAYAIIMPAVYPPVIAMLLALVFRGVAFEYRWRTVRRFSKWFWDTAFFGASLVAAVSQGIILGAILQGIEVEGRDYAGGWLDWLTPFSLLCGVAVAAGYALLGACWLILKTEGEVHDEARRLARLFGLATAAGIVAVSLATPFLEPIYFDRWFTWPTILWLSPVPIAVAALTLVLARSLLTPGRDWLPFVVALALFGLCFAGLGASMWPYVIPAEVTIWDAASPFSSQLFMFVGAIVLVPIILAYTGYAYWVFRGKLDPDQGYH